LRATLTEAVVAAYQQAIALGRAEEERDRS
jgi:hypothetical protein